MWVSRRWYTYRHMSDSVGGPVSDASHSAGESAVTACSKRRADGIATRTFDKLKDWYSERFVDPETGEVLLRREHRLSEHRDHDRQRNGRGDDDLSPGLKWFGIE